MRMKKTSPCLIVSSYASSRIMAAQAIRMRQQLHSSHVDGRKAGDDSKKQMFKCRDILPPAEEKKNLAHSEVYERALTWMKVFTNVRGFPEQGTKFHVRGCGMCKSLRIEYFDGFKSFKEIKSNELELQKNDCIKIVDAAKRALQTLHEKQFVHTALCLEHLLTEKTYTEVKFVGFSNWQHNGRPVYKFPHFEGGATFKTNQYATSYENAKDFDFYCLFCTCWRLFNEKQLFEDSPLGDVLKGCRGSEWMEEVAKLNFFDGQMPVAKPLPSQEHKLDAK